MSKNNKLNQFALTLIMGAIIVAFTFTGVQSFTNSANQVASVDGTPITPDEYNRALNRTLDYWTQINKGKSLTQKEIRERGIREQVLNQLISSKVMLNTAKSMGFDGGKENIKHTLMTQYKEFQTNGKFDVTKYKRLLKLNGISFKKFEEGTVDQVKMNKLNDLIASQRVSKAYVKDMLKYRNQKAKIMGISFKKEEMTEFLSINKGEVETFLKEANAQTIIKSLYDTYKMQNPESKKTMENIQNELAAKHLKRKKRDELKAFNEKLSADLKTAFEKNDWKTVNKLNKKYKLNLQKNAEINLFTAQVPGVEVKEGELRKLFKNKNTTETIINDTPITVNLVKAISFSQTEAKDKEIDDMYNMSNNMMGRSLNFKILEKKRETAKVQQAAGLFN